MKSDPVGRTPADLPSGEMESHAAHFLFVETMRGQHWYDLTHEVEHTFAEPPRAILAARCPLSSRDYLMALFPSGPREMWTRKGSEEWHRVRLSQGALKMVWNNVREASKANAAREVA